MPVWVLTVLGGAGITLVVTRSWLTEGLRHKIQVRSEWLGYLASCPQCLGIWIGFALGLVTHEGWRSLLIAGAVSVVASKLGK